MSQAQRLPRVQSGNTPQRLLVTLLGDYWLGRSEKIPSSCLVRLLGEFSVTSAAARASLSRLSRRGLLEVNKQGRHTQYGLSSDAEVLLSEGVARIMSFGTMTNQWDQLWTVALFSLPEEQRNVRHVLRAKLRWLGFAPVFDGAWVSPRPVADEVASVFELLGVHAATVFRGTEFLSGTLRRPVIQAWDLQRIGGLYTAFLDDYEPLLREVELWRVSGHAALVHRTQVMDRYRQFPNFDPELPDQLMPAGWQRNDVRRVFAEVYDGLGPLAEAYVRELIAEDAGELVELVTHHKTTDILARLPQRVSTALRA